MEKIRSRIEDIGYAWQEGKGNAIFAKVTM